MSKHTAFISFDGLSDPLGQSQILPYLLGLAKAGYRVHIISCEKPARLKAVKSVLEAKLLEAQIEWQYILYNEQGNWLSRWHYTLQLRKMASALHFKYSLELVHCRSYLAALSGLYLYRRFKIPFVFDMRGFWADERVDGGIWRKTNPLQLVLYRYFKKKEKILLQKASAVISLTHAGLEELKCLYPRLQLEHKTKIIPCCTNTQLFDPKKIMAAELPQLPANATLFIYTGSIGTWYYTRELIDCMSVWRKKMPHLYLLILTKDQTALAALLKTLPENKSSFIISEEAEHHEVPKYLRAASAAIFFIKPAYSKKASSPTKMAECWSMNLPIITNSGIGDNDYYFKTNRAGVLLETFTEKDYAAACDTYLNEVNNFGNCRTIAIEHFDHSLAIARYSQVYQEVLNAKAQPSKH